MVTVITIWTHHHNKSLDWSVYPVDSNSHSWSTFAYTNLIDLISIRSSLKLDRPTKPTFWSKCPLKHIFYWPISFGLGIGTAIGKFLPNWMAVQSQPSFVMSDGGVRICSWLRWLVFLGRKYKLIGLTENWPHMGAPISMSTWVTSE